MDREEDPSISLYYIYSYWQSEVESVGMKNVNQPSVVAGPLNVLPGALFF